ncbi:tRNA pseudouridine synthase A [Pseudescherichia vulneris]|nr:tRNA pseudouridine synthase A [Pseudescherichia vulneris]
MSEVQEKPVYRIALGIEYDGSKYYGWQRQNEVRSVQEKLEKALSQVANEPISVFCAGRTDAGVHGTGQVVHFETTALRKDAAWTLGVNANLPGDIAVRWVKDVPDDFHARFSATARRYRYVIYNQRLRPAVLGQGVTHYHQPLDAERMHRAAQCLIGENDFTSFRAVQCQSRTPWRNVMHINVTRYGAYVVVDIKSQCLCTSYGQEHCRQPDGSRQPQPAGELDSRAAGGKGSSACSGNGKSGRAVPGRGRLPRQV